MKKNDICSYVGTEWVYVAEEEDGIRLRSRSKHLSDIIVPYHRKQMIKLGSYNSRR